MRHTARHGWASRCQAGGGAARPSALATRAQQERAGGSWGGLPKQHEIRRAAARPQGAGALAAAERTRARAGPAARHAEGGPAAAANASAETYVACTVMPANIRPWMAFLAPAQPMACANCTKACARPRGATFSGRKHTARPGWPTHDRCSAGGRDTSVLQACDVGVSARHQAGPSPDFVTQHSGGHYSLGLSYAYADATWSATAPTTPCCSCQNQTPGLAQGSFPSIQPVRAGAQTVPVRAGAGAQTIQLSREAHLAKVAGAKRGGRGGGVGRPRDGDRDHGAVLAALVVQVLDHLRAGAAGDAGLG